MPSYVYRAKNGPGQVVEGNIEAESENGAIGRLKQLGYAPLSLSEKSLKKVKPAGLLPSFKKIGSLDITVFSRQLSDLLDAGIPLTDCLSILFQQTENPTFAKIVGEIKEDVQSGASFSASLSKHPKIFSSLYAGMVSAGESGGMLREVLKRIALFSERQEEVKGKIRAAMAYPSLLLGVGFITVFVLVTFVLPKFVLMFKDLGQELPLPTKILFGLSGFMMNYWWLVVGIFFSVFFGFYRFYGTPKGKLSLDQFRLKIPLLGKVARKVEVSNLTRTLGALLENGVAILPSIKIVQSALSNRAIAQDMDRIYEGVNKGARLGELMSKSPYFAPFEVSMISVGEETGKLEQMLLKVAAAYEQEVERSIKMLSSLLEPAMIIILGGFVGFIVFSILLPIFQVNVLLK